MWQSWDNGALGAFMRSEKPNLFNRTGEAVFPKSQRRVSLTFFLPQLFLVFLLHLVAKPWKTCLYSLSPAAPFSLEPPPIRLMAPIPPPPLSVPSMTKSQGQFSVFISLNLSRAFDTISKAHRQAFRGTWKMSYPRLWASEQWRLGKEMHK